MKLTTTVTMIMRLSVVLAAGVLSVQADPPVSTGGDFSLLPADPGTGSGGRVSGGNVTADISTGGAVAGGVSNASVSGAVESGGYTGQLYDPTTLVPAASPSTTVDEGEAVRLSADAVMDDETILTAVETDWTLQNGPVIGIDSNGLAVIGPVTANTTATIRGEFAGIADIIELSIINQPFEANPISWDDPTPGGNGPYRVLFGTSIGGMTEQVLADPNLNFFNPGQLELGTQYFFQIFDADDNDITPGGPGPQSFTTSLYRQDIRIGTKGNPATHRGNNIYNLSGAGQVGKVKMIGRRKGKLHLTVENDGDSADDHTLRGNRASRKFKFIKYFRITGGRKNITAAATRAGFTETDVAPGEMVAYQIHAKANGKKRARQTLKIDARSAKDARAADRAKGKFKGLVKKK